jgi:extradiol dioxygenase family protein
MCMPTPEENMQSVRTFAQDVFGNKNLTFAADWLADDFVEHQVFRHHAPTRRVLSTPIASSRGVARHEPTSTT